jgi:hypothetical protein
MVRIGIGFVSFSKLQLAFRLRMPARIISEEQLFAYCQILPLSPNFGGYSGLRRVVKVSNLPGNYDKLPIPRGVCNQQVVGSSPTAGSSF